MKKRKILYIQYTNPGGYPPLGHSSELLATASWKVLFWGTHSFGENDLIRFKILSNRRVYLLPYCSRGWLQKLHYFLYTVIALIIVAIWRPEWVYASDYFSCPVALIAKITFRIKVLYHEHDSPDSTKNDSIYIKGLLKARRRLSHAADICILPNVKRLESFLRETGTKALTFCVWNCPQKNEVPTKPAKVDARIRLYFHGTITPKSFPLIFLKALARVITPDVLLIIIGNESIHSRGYIQKIRRESQRLEISHSVEIFLAMQRKELLKKCAECDIGLAAMGSRADTEINWKNMLGASNKIFDYMACGLALLVPDAPDWRDVFVSPGYGISYDPENLESIEKAFRLFLSNPNEVFEMGKRAREKIITDWNYENQFAPVLNVLLKEKA